MTLQELFGIQLPIIQAPMAGWQGCELAIAVSDAGGLGSLPCAMLTPEGIRAELQAIRAATDQPFNVNFFCHTPPTADAKREAAWRELLAPYFREYGIVPADGSAGGSRAPFSAAAADVLEQRGVDAVIAQGAEAGGHRGIFLSQDLTTQVGTFALLPQVVKAVGVPVIAAGGIADATGVAAAMSLGAAGAQLGTAYLLCPEAKTSAVHRAAIKSDRASHTAITNLFSGRPARGIMNRFMAELGPINEAAPAFPLAAEAVAQLRKKAESVGSGDFSPLWAGQNVSGCKEISAAELTRALIR
jgi:nitronate monooxygenase